MNKKIMTIGAALAIGALAFVGCQSNPKASKQNSSLTNTHWELVSLEGKAIGEDIEKIPFITFNKDGTFNGNLGCNLFFGEYYQHKSKLELKNTGSTKMLCGNMETEDNFSKALRKKISKFEIDGKKLTIYSGNEVLFVFEDKTDTHPVEAE
ncbi:MAG: META domain-containing protein [Bacteroidales bacterium]|nr:META domain-containing protein [Bacteroidales bacterium]